MSKISFGGALIGFIYANQLQKGNDIGAVLDRIWGYVNSFFVSNKKNNMRTVHRSKNRSQENLSNLQQDKIDSILDKISKSGYESTRLPLKVKASHCSFEPIYFSRPDSIIKTRTIYDYRKKMGTIR